MPPKNKKDAEEEARRLQQQRKKKQQEQALLQLERKKYAGQTLSTSLFLPASNQLIIDFTSKSLQFIGEKLRQCIIKQYQHLTDQQHWQLLLKELHYVIKDSRKLFNLQQIISVQNNQKELLKARAFIGIYLQIFMNDNQFNNGAGKNKQNDQKLAKKLLQNHCINEQPNKMEIFNKKQIGNILVYLADTYFANFNLVFNYRKFPKRSDLIQASYQISAPNIFQNQKQTPFKDLSENNAVKNQEIIPPSS